jgi:hypothetical protein
VRVALLVAVTGVAVSAGCKLHTPGTGRAEVREARQAAALAWVNALGAGAGDASGERLRQLTASSLVFRSTGDERSCEGRVAADDAFTGWLACARAKPDLRAFSDALTLYRQALAADAAKNTELERYLPRIAGGDEAWSRYVAADERERSENAFRSLKKEAGNDGEWTTVVATWLYTTMTVRLQVIGTAEAPRVHAVLVDVHRTSD